MVSARFEPSNKSSLSSNQYATIPGIKQSKNYASPNDVPIPTANAHYEEFIDAKQLVEMNQQVAASQPPEQSFPTVVDSATELSMS